jgi:hypothetical protein
MNWLVCLGNMELQGVKLLSLTSLKDVHKQGNRAKLIPSHILFSVEEIGLDSTVSGQGPVAGCCECGDEPSGSCATELVS